MTIFNEILREKAPCARTNMIQLQGTPAEAITKLSQLANDTCHVGVGTTELKQNRGEDEASYRQRLDQTIKAFIAKQVGSKSTVGIHYSLLGGAKFPQAFLFVMPGKGSGIDLIDVVNSLKLDEVKVLEALLKLRLKMSMLDSVGARYEIAPIEYNADLIFGLMPISSPTKANSRVSFDALVSDLYLSKHLELALNVRKQVMLCGEADSKSSTAETGTGTVMLDWAGKRYQSERKLNATMYSKRPFMAFNPAGEKAARAKPWKLYENSINYHITDNQNRLLKVLTAAGVAHEPTRFQATHKVVDFICEAGSNQNKLVILDTIQTYASEQQAREYRDHLKAAFGANEVIGADKLPAPEALPTNGNSYLVVSGCASDNEGSISIKDDSASKELKTFWKALAAHFRNPETTFDYYTSVKLHRFLEDRSLVTQGIDVVPGVAVEAPVIQRIQLELALKEAVFTSRSVTVDGPSLPEMTLDLINCRNVEGKIRYVQVLVVRTSGQTVEILDDKRYDKYEAGEFGDRFQTLAAAVAKPGASAFEALQDGSFLIHDHESGAWLNSYNSPRVPRIIGNALFDNQEATDLGQVLNRTVQEERNPLPYYLVPTVTGQRYGVYVQDNSSEGAQYFVSKKNPPNAVIDKQTKINNVLVIGANGEKQPVLEHPLGQLFFSTFTVDVLALKESAKSSLLQKLVELYINN